MNRRESRIGRRTGVFLLFVVMGLPLLGGAQQEDPANAANLAKLKHADMEVRIAGLRTLQTSLDPRIPAALLPLLSDEGNSIRRLAARGVGSRWHQVPQAETPNYLAALEPLLERKGQRNPVANMAERAVGLLSRKYEGAMFAPSPDGKWVIYERRGLPCLIDRERDNEELLGWSDSGTGGWFSPAWSNGQVAPYATWEADSQAVALDIIIARKASTFWFWKASDSTLVSLEPHEILKGIGTDPKAVLGPAGFFVSGRGWKRAEYQFTVFYTLEPVPPSVETADVRAVAGWHLETGKLRAVPKDEQLPDPEKPQN